jgi:hypothetical protein
MDGGYGPRCSGVRNGGDSGPVRGRHPLRLARAADVAFFAYHYFFWNYQHANGYTPLSTAPLAVFGVAVAMLIATVALFTRGALSAGTEGQA